MLSVAFAVAYECKGACVEATIEHLAWPLAILQICFRHSHSNRFSHHERKVKRQQHDAASFTCVAVTPP
eukprot:5042684-Amphidinium_carterae.1